MQPSREMAGSSPDSRALPPQCGVTCGCSALGQFRHCSVSGPAGFLGLGTAGRGFTFTCPIPCPRNHTADPLPYHSAAIRDTLIDLLRLLMADSTPLLG